MTTQNKLNKQIFWLIIAVGIIIVLFVLVLAKIVKDNNDCKSNPFVYGAEKLIEQDQNLNILCSCDMIGEKPYNRFYFNQEGISIEEPASADSESVSFDSFDPDS